MARNLSQGSVGPDVRNLQQLLNLHLDPKDTQTIDEDGVFGQQTDARVRAFQAFCGLTVDGVVGPDTGAMLLPERTYTQTAVLFFDEGGGDFVTSFPPAAPPSQFSFASFSADDTGDGDDPPPAPNPTPPTPQPNQRFAQFQVLAGGQQAFNPKLFSPLVITAQYNLIIRNPGKTDLTLTAGGQFAMNTGGTKGPAGAWTGQGFAQFGFAANKKIVGFDLLNPFVVTMLSRNQDNKGQHITWGLGFGDQVNYGLDRAGRWSLFFNAQVVTNVDLTNGIASAPGVQLLGGVSFTLGQIPPDPTP